MTPNWIFAMIPPTMAASSGTPTVSGISSRRRIVAVRYASPPETTGTSAQNIAIRR
jgi:hypothetical protein